jgi:hypothetical protein
VTGRGSNPGRGWEFFSSPPRPDMSRDSSVGITLGYGLDDWGSRVRFPAGVGIFLFTTLPDQEP